MPNRWYRCASGSVGVVELGFGKIGKLVPLEVLSLCFRVCRCRRIGIWKQVNKNKNYSLVKKEFQSQMET